MKAKKLRGNYVLVVPDAVEETTESGIVLKKDKDQGDFHTGTVKIVGTGRLVEGIGHIPVDLEVGERVAFQYGMRIRVDGELMLLVNEEDVRLNIE